MDINNWVICGCSRYRINLITREIISHKGKIVKTYLNKNGKETVQMACETGKRKTMLVDTIMKNAISAIAGTAVPIVVEHVMVFEYDQSYVYHIHKVDDTDLANGYIGVTDNPKQRYARHADKPWIENTIMDLIYKGDREDCFLFEYGLRYNPKMGWNDYPGGKSGWWNKTSGDQNEQ